MMNNYSKLILGSTLFVGLVLMAGSLAFSQSSIDKWANFIRDKYGGTTINISIAAKHPATEAIREMAPEFTQLTGIKLEWSFAPQGQLQTKHFMEYSAKTRRFDVLMVDSFWISEYTKKGVISALNPFIENNTLTPGWYDYEDIIPAYRNGLGMVNGKIYGIPFAGATRIVGYRKDLFDKYGLQPPKSLQEMLEIARFFKDEVPGVYGMAMRGKEGIQFASAWLQLIYQFGGGFIDQRSLKVTADSPETIRSLEYFINLLRTAPPGVENFSVEESASAFSTGKTALWYDGTPVVYWIEDPEKSEVAGKVRYIAPPPGPEGAYAPLAGWDLGISSQSRSPEAAWVFICWATGKETSYRFYKKSKCLNRLSLLGKPDVTSENPSFFDAYKKALDQAQNLVTKGMSWIPPVPVASSLLKIAGEYGSRALVGLMTPTEACRKMALEMRKVMSEIKE